MACSNKKTSKVSKKKSVAKTSSKLQKKRLGGGIGPKFKPKEDN
jgi:hypothetical protein